MDYYTLQYTKFNNSATSRLNLELDGLIFSKIYPLNNLK